MKKPNITHERLKEVLLYDPETGIFTRRVKRRKWGIDTRVGTPLNSMYWAINVDRKLYLAHRLAWFYVYGEWPPKDIDHINRDRQDNRLANLRLAVRSQNNFNAKRAIGRTGFRGVYYDSRRKKYTVRPWIYCERRSLGSYDTAEEAHAVYMAVVKERHGEFFRDY